MAGFRFCDLNFVGFGILDSAIWQIYKGEKMQEIRESVASVQKQGLETYIKSAQNSQSDENAQSAHIVFGCDDLYAKYLSVVISSIIYATKGKLLNDVRGGAKS